MVLIDVTSPFTFPRTLTEKTARFRDENPLPQTANLRTHIKNFHRSLLSQKTVAEEPEPEVTTKLHDHGFNMGSAKIMEAFLAEGKINPQIIVTQKGFYRVFAAWLLEDNLPWTTGETPGIARLFKYIKSTFSLPSDTTVRNELGRIFAELHGLVVKELTVSVS
jgi:hypothetical protein